MSEFAIEEMTRRFYAWEVRGRGWRAYPYPVALEPFFQPFTGYARTEQPFDDGRRTTGLSRIGDWWKRRSTEAANPAPEAVSRRMPEASPPDMAEWDIEIPLDAKIDAKGSEAWLRSTILSGGRFAWEYIATSRTVTLRLAAERANQAAVNQLSAFVDGAQARRAEESISAMWDRTAGVAMALEFGLAREFLMPLQTVDHGPHPLTPFLGAMGDLAIDELAIVQFLFEEVVAPWAEHALWAVTSPDGEPFFLDAPELTELAQEKFASPVYAAGARIAVVSPGENRTWEIIRSIAGAFGQYGSPVRNEFVPLGNADPERLGHEIATYTNSRSGMILSLPELASLVRLPDASVRSPRLRRLMGPVECLFQRLEHAEGPMLGHVQHRGLSTPIHLPNEARLQHTHIIGATGTGKSTLIERMILDDMEAGAGVAVLDLHGDLIDDILPRIPSHRIDDVVLIDPPNPETSAGWNILAAHSEIEKQLLTSDLVAVIRRQSTSWGDQMTAVLANAITAIVESKGGGTLADLRRFLLGADVRKHVLNSVDDSYVVSFWEKEFPLIAGRHPEAPILTRLDTFLRSRAVREVVTRQSNGVDFRDVIDSGKIVLAKLSQGTIGEENAALLGALLVSKLHQVTLSRQDVSIDQRRPFYLFIDEFQHLVTPSMASLFSGVRKYRLGVTVSHHDLYTLHAAAPEVERALLTNANTRIIFKVSDEDAVALQGGLLGFDSPDITSLGRGEAICRFESRRQSFRLNTDPLPELPADHIERRAAVIAASRERYGKRTEQQTAGNPRASVADSGHVEPTIAAPELAIPKPDPTPGRGGSSHKYLQSLVQQWGQAAGFKAEIEHQLSEGGRVDVALFREELSIACEIAGTTTIDRELANVEKCLAAGFSRVISVSLNTAFLRTLDSAIAAHLDEAARARVTLCSPEELVTILRPENASVSEHRVAGYKVRTRRDGTVDGERRQAIADVILKSLKRMREKDP